MAQETSDLPRLLVRCEDPRGLLTKIVVVAVDIFAPETHDSEAAALVNGFKSHGYADECCCAGWHAGTL